MWKYTCLCEVCSLCPETGESSCHRAPASGFRYKPSQCFLLFSGKQNKFSQKMQMTNCQRSFTGMDFIFVSASSISNFLTDEYIADFLIAHQIIATPLKTDHKYQWCYNKQCQIFTVKMFVCSCCLYLFLLPIFVSILKTNKRLFEICKCLHTRNI